MFDGVKAMLGMGKWPVKLVLFRLYRNVLTVDVFQARYRKTTVKEENGVYDKRALEYRDNGRIIELPNFNLPSWMKVGAAQELHLLEIDLNHYLVTSYEDGVEYVDVPVWQAEVEKDEAGAEHIKHDADGQVVLARDADGKLIQVGTERKILYDARFMNDAGEIKAIPKGTFNKANDRELILANELIAKNRRYGLHGGLTQWLPVIAVVIACLALLAVAWMNNDNTNKNHAADIEAQRAMTSTIANATKYAADVVWIINQSGNAPTRPVAQGVTGPPTLN